MAKSLETRIPHLRAVSGRALGAGRQRIAPPPGASGFAVGCMKALEKAGNGAQQPVAAFYGGETLGHWHSPASGCVSQPSCKYSWGMKG